MTLLAAAADTLLSLTRVSSLCTWCRFSTPAFILSATSGRVMASAVRALILSIVSAESEQQGGVHGNSGARLGFRMAGSSLGRMSPAERRP